MWCVGALKAVERVLRCASQREAYAVLVKQTQGTTDQMFIENCADTVRSLVDFRHIYVRMAAYNW